MPTIADLRAKYPDLAGLDDEQTVDAVHQAFYADLPRDQVAASLGVKPPPAPKAKRSMGEAISDTGRGIMSGAAGLVKTGGELYGLATGDMENAATQLGADAQQYWEDGQSPALKEKRADRKAAIDASPSMLGKFGTAIYETLKDPALMGDVVASNVATMVPGMAVGRVAAAGRVTMAMRAAQGAGPVSMAEQAAIAKGAGTLGTAAAVGAAAVQQGADVSGDTYDDTLRKTAEQLAANPDFIAGVQAKVQAGMDEPSAILATKKELGNTAARAAFVPATAISLAANAIPGSTMLERALVGGAAKNTIKAGGGKFAAMAKAGIGEAAQETLEEGGGAFAGNVAKQRYVDPNQDLSDSVGENAGLGFVGGLGMGVPGGALHGHAAPGDEIRAQKLEEVGPLTRGVNAGLEDTAQRVDSGALPVVSADQLVTHAQQRLAELDKKAKGTKEEKVDVPDGEPIVTPGTPGQFLTADEIEERKQLSSLKDDPKALARAMGVELGTPAQIPVPPAPPAAPVEEAAAAPTPAPARAPAPVAKPAPSREAAVQREADRPAEVQGEILPGDRLNKRGGPFLSMPGAMSELGRAGEDTHEIVKVTGGLVVRPKAPAAGSVSRETDDVSRAKPVQATTAAQPTTLGDAITAQPAGTRGTTAADLTIDAAAHEAAPSPKNDRPEPTQAQKEAGNYKLGHDTIGGLDLSFENPAGSVRRGVDRDGTPWENTLQHHYGYIKGTIGNDKDHVDAFVKPSTPRDYAGPVFVVDQIHPDTKKFDEHKVLIGFDTIEEAKAAYRANYAKGWKGMQAISAMPFNDFKAWVKDGPKNAPLVPITTKTATNEQDAQARATTEAAAPEARADQAGAAPTVAGEGAGVPAARPAAVQADGLKEAREPKHHNAATRAIKPLDHGELNIPGRTNNINAQLDKHKAETAAASKAAAKETAIQRRNDKIEAKRLLAEHEAGMIASLVQKGGGKITAKEAAHELDQLAKWEPKKLIAAARAYLKGFVSDAPAAVPEPAGVPVGPIEALRKKWPGLAAKSDAVVVASEAWDQAAQRLVRESGNHETGAAIHDKLVDELGQKKIAADQVGYLSELTKRLTAAADAIESNRKTDGTLANRREAKAADKSNEARNEHMHKANLEEIDLALQQVRKMHEQGRITDDDLSELVKISDTSKDSFETASRLHDLLESKVAAREVPTVEKGAAVNEPAFETTPDPKPTAPAAKSPNAATKTRAKKSEIAAAEAEARRAAYFTPGNVVKSYGGFDEVLAYNAPTKPGGAWSVRVHEVKKVDDQWVRIGKPQDARTHSTQPDARELAKGPVAQVAPQPAATVPHTEPRADGKEFPNAEARGAARVHEEKTGVVNPDGTVEGEAPAAPVASRAPSFDAHVDAVLDGKKSEADAVMVASAPPVYTALGMNALPVATTGDRIAKLHFDHGLTRAEIKALPELLAEPVMVFASDTQPGSLVAVLDLWKNGVPVIAALKPDAKLGRVQVNLLASAYAKPGNVLGNWVSKGLLRYADKEKTRAWATNGGVQFPWLVQLRRGSASSVLGPADVVKPPSASRGGETGMPVDALRAAVASVVASWKNGPKGGVTVVKSADELPENLLRSVRSSDPDGQARAWYDPSNEGVYLIANKLPTTADAQFALFHEVYGHFGMRSVLGDAYEPQMMLLRRANPSLAAEASMWVAQYGRQEVAARVARGMDPLRAEREVRLLSTEEALADRAGADKPIKAWEKVSAKIQQFLRSIGLDAVADWMEARTETETLAFLAQARAVVREGEKVGARGAAPVAAVASRALTLETLQRVADTKLPAGYLVGDFLNSDGKIGWWHKTVGSMHNLAERSPVFKRVYDAVQNFINDVSLYATEAADLAPRILPKLENWKDIGKSPLSAADTKAIAAPIFEGTLSWGRDEMGRPVKMDDLRTRADALDSEAKANLLMRTGKLAPMVLRMWQGLPIEQFEAIVDGKFEREMLKPGVVWKDTELKSMFNLTDAQIPLYREFRAATDRSLTNLALTEMIQLAGADAAGLRAEVLATNDVNKAGVLLRDHLFERADSDPARKGTLNDTGNRMIDIADRAKDLMTRGYAPLSRFGEYTLDVVVDGERKFFSLYESKAERAKMARTMRAEFPTAKIEQGTISQEGFKLFAGVSPETMELFGEMLGLDAGGTDASSEAFAKFVKLTKSNRSTMQRLVHRKGIAGFSEDAGRVLAGFVYSNARKTSSNLHMKEVDSAVNDVPQGQGEMKDAASRLADYVKNPREEAQAFRGLLFAQYLGGSVASAMVNMTQPVAVTFPYLSQFGGVGKAAARMTAAGKDALKKTTGDAKLDAALKHAEEQGIVAPQEVHQLMAQAGGRATLKAGDGTAAGNATAKASNALSKLSLAWGKVFGVAEQFNRRITFIAAYRTAIGEGIDNAAEFAAKAVAETQFTYNKGNKPRWARGAIGGTLFTFKSFSVQYLELLHRMATRGGPEGKKAALLALAVMFLLSGSSGIPFADDLDDLIDGLMQRLGYNFSGKRAKQEFFANLLGAEGGRFVEHGLSGLPGVPIDVSGRLGLGNLIPGTGLLTRKKDHTSDLGELFGPGGDLVKRAFQSVGQLVDGDPGKAIATISPTAVRNVIQASDMAGTGSYNLNGKKIITTDGGDAVAKALGFQPNRVARFQEAKRQEVEMIEQTNMRKSELNAAMALAIFNKDADKRAEALAMRDRWNESNPDTKININMGSVLKQVASMREDAAARVTRTAPKDIRARVRRELAQASE